MFSPVQDRPCGPAGYPTLGGMKRTLLITVVAALGLATVAAAPAYAAPITGAGYVWANDSTAAFYTPTASYNFNSTDPFDTVNTVSRTEDGIGPLYTVRFPGLGLVGGTVQVTAYGSGSVACQAQGRTANSPTYGPTTPAPRSTRRTRRT
jgi:hypothetical protein